MSAPQGAGHVFAWTGGSGARWNAAPDWRDLSLSRTASAAPGALDLAIISNVAVRPLVVAGGGAAAAMATHGAVQLDGSFRVATLDVEGTLGMAGAVSLGALGQAGAAVPSSVVVSAGTLTVATASVLGGLSVGGGARAQLGAVASVSAGVTVDAASCVEVGSGGSFWPGWLKVYAGGTLSGAGAISASAVVNGTVLSSGLRFGGLLTGAGQIRFDAGGLTVGQVTGGTTLTFAAPGAVLTLTTPGQMAGTLAGFAAGDALDVAGTLTAATYLANSSGGGALSLAGAGGAAASLTLAGSPAVTAASRFLLLPDGSGGTLVLDLPAASGGPPGAGNATPHRDAWIGPSGGTWNAASSWRDLTLGQAATVAPGSLDHVSIVGIGGAIPLIVTGTGAAAAIATHGAVLLDGSFNAATLDVEGTLSVAGLGSVLTLGALGQAGAAVPSSVLVNAGTLAVSAGSVLGALSVAGGGRAKLGGVVTLSAGVTVDSQSCAEIGTGGAFWPGWLKVYAGGTLSGSGAVSAYTVVNGTVLSSGLRFAGLLTGAGQVRMDGAGLTVGQVSAGTGLVFAAAGAVLALTAPSRMAGTLFGLAAGNGIDVTATLNAASFRATSAGGGVLTLGGGGGGGPVATLMLSGDPSGYAASRFLLLPDGAGGTLVLDVAAAAGGTPSAGNATPHQNAWSGASGAAWNLASSWQDQTLGRAAAVAPGSLDSVTIVGAGVPMVVTGSGNAAAMATHGSVVLDGSFHAAMLNVEGTLDLAGLGSVLTLGLLGQAGAAVPSSILVNTGTMAVTGASALGSLAVAGGARAQLGATASVSAGVSVDAASCVEVGSGGSFWPGWLKVYAGGTLSGSGAVSTDTVVNGTVLSSGLRFGGLLTGAGQVRFDASGLTVGRVSGGTSLVFAGPGAVLTVTAPAQMGGALSGLVAGDGIDLAGMAASSAGYRALDANHGILSVADLHGAALASFALTGAAASYQAAAFGTVSDGAGGTMVIETAASASAWITHPS